MIITARKLTKVQDLYREMLNKTEELRSESVQLQKIEIDERKSAMSEEQELKLLAASDPKAKALIDEMKKLRGE